MSYEDERLCNEIIDKVQKLCSLLRSVVKSTQDVVYYLESNIKEQHLQLPVVSDMDQGSTFRDNVTELTRSLLEIKRVLDIIHKSLGDDIEPELYKDLESKDLELSDRILLLEHAKNCCISHDIVAAFVLRFSPNIFPLLTAISDSLLAQISIDAFTKGDSMKSLDVDFQTFLKDINLVLLSAADGIEYNNAIKTIP